MFEVIEHYCVLSQIKLDKWDEFNLFYLIKTPIIVNSMKKT